MSTIEQAERRPAMKATRVCSVDLCTGPVKARALCQSHYRRWQRGGTVETPILDRSHVGSPCRVVGCERLNFGNGLCGPHYKRNRKYGDPLGSRPAGNRRLGAERHTWQGDAVGYSAAHSRVKALRGPAWSHRCACGSHAEDWAYDHRDPAAREDSKGRPYSPNPDHYFPACRGCHKRYDVGRHHA
ncbi:MAG: hypothetical protein L0I76_24420 [Pseudonocardia sp.]|nr:hypothetical protein [Pseudonocardia sp.]